jgi:hypothetical protein
MTRRLAFCKALAAALSFTPLTTSVVYGHIADLAGCDASKRSRRGGGALPGAGSGVLSMRRIVTCLESSLGVPPRFP